MRCPFCNHNDTKVTDSRAADEGVSIRRRRECTQCGKRFTTYETVEEIPLMVVKRNGRRELFDRDKVLKGLLRSCNKRTVSTERLEEMAASVERGLQNELDREVTTERIGERILAELREVDQVAYVRFASVYRQFDNIDSFMEELKQLKKTEAKRKKG